MKLASDIFFTLVLFGLFGFLHSFLASGRIKNNIAEKGGTQIAFYRLFYNAVSLLSFFAFYELSPKPDLVIYDLKPPYDIIMFSLQAASLLGFIWAFSKWDWKEFLGIKQISRYHKGTYRIEDLDAMLEFDSKGLYKFSRHPVYLFCILFLGFQPFMDLFHLLFFAGAAAYFYIGSYYEEKKLIERFGDEYREYIKRVPRIFPLKIFNKV